MSGLSSWRKKVDKRLAELAAVRATVRAEKGHIEAAIERTDALMEAQDIAQKVAQQVQSRAHNQISGIVSKCLEAVFDEPYVFHIVFERKRGRTEARLVFERDGMEVDPMTASGGGVIDVAAFALRLSCLILARPPLRRLLVLDEPFRFVSTELRPRVRAMLNSLAEETGVQFVLVTHDPQLQTGKVVRLNHYNLKTSFRIANSES